jgi:hypothetical protein
MAQTHGGPPVKGLLRTSGAFLEALGAALVIGAIVSSFIVATLAFDPRSGLSRPQAGEFNARMFHALVGLQWLGAVMLFFGVLARREFGSAMRLVLVLAILLCSLAQIGTTALMNGLREEVGGSMDAVARDDPRRVEFGRMHAFYFVEALGSIAGASVFLLSKARSEQ